jgi:hydroxyacylglutathione hydrolase
LLEREIIVATQFHTFRCLSDNHGILVHDPDTKATFCVDAPDAATIIAALDEKGWTLTHVLATHEHGDHVDGIPDLKERYGCHVFGSPLTAKVAPVDSVVGEGRRIHVGSIELQVFDTPGHADGHVVYYSERDYSAFVGDVLFVMGCGRIFGNGSPEQLYRSIEKIAALPDNTWLFTGHDYTVANARFALSVEPDNITLQLRSSAAEVEKTAGRLFAATRLSDERLTNPFLRCAEPSIRKSLDKPDAPAEAIFAALRARKDRF